MSERNVVLVRSPRELIASGEIGYGWKNVDFSSYRSANELIESGFRESGRVVGRKTKQIKRYFNIKENDLIVIPLSGSIAIAVASNDKSYDEDPTVKNGENRIKVNYLNDGKGRFYIPRKALTTELQSRLKIRMSIADLNDFGDEIEKHVDALSKGDIHTWEKEVEAREMQAEDEFKEELLHRLKKGKNIGISSGGYGLELLVKELLEIRGYKAKIPAKNTSSGIEDVDIIASRVNDLTSDLEGLFIQVKHHDGLTHSKGLKQLDAYCIGEDYSFYRKVLITTARLDESVKRQADDKTIVTMEGKELVGWIYDNIEQLKSETKVLLGITTTPSLV